MKTGAARRALERNHRDREPLEERFGLPALNDVLRYRPILDSVVAAIAAGCGFKQGRDFAAWLGLVPKKKSNGENRTETRKGFASSATSTYAPSLLQAAHVVLERRAAAAMRAL